MESTRGYTFTPCVGYFTSPGIDTREKGSTAFSVSSERQRYTISNVESQVFNLKYDVPGPKIDPSTQTTTKATRVGEQTELSPMGKVG